MWRRGWQRWKGYRSGRGISPRLPLLRPGHRQSYRTSMGPVPRVGGRLDIG